MFLYLFRNTWEHSKKGVLGCIETQVQQHRQQHTAPGMVEDPGVDECPNGDHTEIRDNSNQGDRPTTDWSAARKPEQRRLPEGVHDPREDAAPKRAESALQPG